jgi:AraC-like DNA-binding protein
MNLEIIKDIFNFLMIAGIILGIFFIVSTSLSRRGKHISVIYLTLVVLFLTLNNLQIVLVDGGYVSTNFFVRKLLIPWYLLIFPSFYAFLMYYLKIEKKIYSFVPVTIVIFAIEMIFRIGLGLNFYNENNNYIVAKYSQIEEIVNASFSIFLYIKAFLLLFRYSNLYQYVLSYDNIKWLKIFMCLGSLVILLWVTAIVCNLGKVINPVIYIYYPMRLSCSIILYWIGYQGFFNYNIMTQRIQLRKAIAEQVKEVVEVKSEIPNIIENKEESFLLVKKHIENNNRYLDSEFSLEILASEIKMSTTKVSNIINQNSQFNFSDYINQLRIEKAKTLLIVPKYADYNIEAIGYECGFNSKSTFYLAFKKFTTITPTEFRKQNTA